MPESRGTLDYPGPGAYSHTIDRHSGFFGDSPSYTLGMRKAMPVPVSASPGPIYSPQVMTAASGGPIGDAPAFTPGASQRFGAERPGTQKGGPGERVPTLTRIGSTVSLGGDAPKYGFGTENRDGAGGSTFQLRRVASAPPKRFLSRDLSRTIMAGVHSPGPKYMHQDGLGVVLVGKGHPNEPRYSMRPRLEREPSKSEMPVPGPGQYPCKHTLGPRSDYYPKMQPQFSFGTAERPPKKPIYLGKAYENGMIGPNTPGPGTYKHGYQNGVEPHKFKAAPTFSFGSDSRF